MSDAGTDPRVSIVMAVHDGAAHLRAAIESVLAQTMADFELIVIDDGSTDETPAIVHEYATRDRRIVAVRNAANIGLTKSLNRGLAMARGEFIARQDADDTSLPGRLAAQVAFLDAHPEVGLVGTAYHVIDEQGNRRATHRTPVSDTEIRWEMLFHNAFCHTSVMFRRSLLRVERGYDETFPVCQDYEFWSRLLRHTVAANLPAPLVERRTHGASIGARRGGQQQHAASVVARRAMARLAPELELSLEEIDTLRTWYNAFPRQPDERSVPLCGKLALILETFAQQDGLDPAIVETLRRRWTQRIESAIPAGAFPVARAGGFQPAGTTGRMPVVRRADGPRISVVVCTYNRSRLLAQVMQGLCEQSLDRRQYEIIVVDNGSTDDTAGVVERFVLAGHVRYRVETRPGLSHARNRGWREARGEYVAYVDDDCRVPSGWLAVGADVIEAVAPAMFGGPYYAFYETPKPAWFKDSYATHDNGGRARLLGRHEYLSGGNMFVRRDLLERLGGFDPALGMSGEAIGYGEETHLQLRIRAAMPDAAIYYEPRLFVYHLVRPQKMSLRWMVRQHLSQGRAAYHVFDRARQVGRGREFVLWRRALRATLSFAGDITYGVLMRDRDRYPYAQNYLYERAFPHLGALARLYEQYRYTCLPNAGQRGIMKGGVVARDPR